MKTSIKSRSLKLTLAHRGTMLTLDRILSLRRGRTDTKAFVVISHLQHRWSCRVRCSCWQVGPLPYTCCAALACPCRCLSCPCAGQMSPGTTHGSLNPPGEIIWHFPEGGAPLADRCGAGACLRSWDAAGPTVTWGRACLSNTPWTQVCPHVISPAAAVCMHAFHMVRALPGRHYLEERPWGSNQHLGYLLCS